MYFSHKFTVSERDVSSSPLLHRHEAQAGVQFEDNERTPVQNELSTKLPERQLFNLDNNKRRRAIPCKLIIEHINVLNLHTFENEKPGHVA